MRSFVLITGAAGGLGKAFAAECAFRGWDLFLTDINAQALSPLAQGLSRLYNVDILHFPCDLTDPLDRQAFWGYVENRGLTFHMLINVAGLDFEGLFKDRDVEELRTIIRLNVEATVEITRRVLQFRDVCRTLRIINVSSLASFYPMPVKAVYAASKRFLLDLSLALNQELAGNDVTVTALCPAGMPTTPETIRGIDAQGFMGQATTLNVGDVAARTIDFALVGRSVYIPGILNQVLRLLGGLFPPTLVAALIDRRWRKASQKFQPVA